jgi:prophage regulatory protein
VTDILEALSRRAGRLNFDELIEDRVLAVQEIRRLRSALTLSGDRPLGGRIRAMADEPDRSEKPQVDDPSRLVRLRELVNIVGLSRSSIYRLVSNGTFPQPIKLSERATAWRMADVRAWQTGLRGR